MAGKRLHDNDAIVLNGDSFKENDAIVICNQQDRKINVLEFLNALANGTGLSEGFTFATSDQLNSVITGTKYKIENGELKYYNASNSQWYTINVVNTNGDTIKWSKDTEGNGFYAVSVNDSGEIQYPSNFITANKIVTADGGQLKSIKAGTGLIGTDYNGNDERTWQLDWESVQAKINEAIATLNKKLMATIKANSYVTADNGEQVAIKARIIEIDGMKVPQFYPEIITETEEDE